MGKRCDELTIHGGAAVRSLKASLNSYTRLGLIMLTLLLISGSAFGQGSIFGTVANSDLSTPANGELVFVGFLNDTDEEIRLESSVGAGYDNGNWFDDFQNYLTSAAGNPYDHLFYNVATGEGFHLAGAIPNNSFQQENVTLAQITWPAAPLAVQAVTVSGTSVVVSWSAAVGTSYHVYRRAGSSLGSFFRIDNPAGLLTDFGVTTNYFVDNTTDGVSAYTYVVIADDGAGNLSPHSSTVTVNTAVIDAPILTSLDPDSGSASGGTVINVSGSGFDPAGTSVLFDITSIPATVNSPFSLTLVAPAGTVGTSANILVSNNASSLVSNTLTNGYVFLSNAPPVMAAISPQSVTEGVLLQFVATAVDLDGDIPLMTSSVLPGTATYVDNTDGTGSFSWTPAFTAAGIYNVTFYATDAVVPSVVDSQSVQITVAEAGNQAPSLAAVNDTTIAEGTTLVLVITATDLDGEIPSLSVTGEPTNAVLVDNLDGTGEFTFTPDYTQTGVYNVVFKALDASLDVDSISVQISVTEVNQPPVLTAIGGQTGVENSPLVFAISALDADGPNPILTTSLLPGTAQFTDSLNGAGLFEWTPGFDEAGVYNVTFYATDSVISSDVDSELVVITITDAGNQAPALATLTPQSLTEGGYLGLVVSATDPDGTIPTIWAESLPTNAFFTDSLNGTGLLEFNPDFTQAGQYTVTIIAADGVLTDSEFVSITVIDAGNVAPEIDSIGNFTINEGDSLSIPVVSNDPDGGGAFPGLSVSTTLSNYTFVDNGDGTGLLTYLPDFFDAGVDTINFLALDFGSPQQSSSMLSEITTLDINQPPVIDSIGPVAVAAGDSLTFVVTTSDSTDSNPVHRVLLSALSLPLNAAFVDNGDGTGLFSFLPDLSQVGLNQVTFLAVDQGVPQLSASLTIDINVVAENQAPVLDPIGPQALMEGTTLVLSITAFDPDGGIVSIDTAGAPEGVTFVDNGDNTADFTFTPSFVGGQRLISVTFKAFDGITVTKELVLIQIYDAGNQLPYFDSIPTPIVMEGDTLTQGITASDPDGETVLMTIDESIMPLPPNSEFMYLGLGLGAIIFAPDYTQAGLYDFYVVVFDGPEGDSTTLSDTIVVTVEVTEFGNLPPVIEQLTDQTITEGSTRVLAVSASDLDGTFPVLTTTILPANALFTDNDDGTGSFSFTPDLTQAGTYPITFYADDGLEIDSTVITITVLDLNQEPICWTYGGHNIYEADTLTFDMNVTDADGTIAYIEAFLSGSDSLATNMSFVDNRDNSATITFMPDYFQGGPASGPTAYYIVFRAIDGDYPLVSTTSATVTVNVTDRNKPPELIFPSGIGPYSALEGGQVLFTVQVADDDAVSPPSLTATNMPAANANFNYNPLTRSGTFQFDPDFLQAGTYLVTFEAIDDRLASVSQVVQIDIIEAGNQPPNFGDLYDDTLHVPTNHLFEIVLQPTDPEADSISVEATPVLPGATWVNNGDGTWTYSFTADEAAAGSVFDVTFVVTDYPHLATDTLETHSLVVTFLRGDLDNDSKYSVNDMAFLIAYLFRDGPGPVIEETADVDNDSTVTISDLAYLIAYMYRLGPQPAP